MPGRHAGVTALRVRPGSAADATFLAEFGALTFRDAFGADNRPEDVELYLSRTYGAPQQRAELSDPGQRVLLAELAGQMVGYAQLRSGRVPPCVNGPSPIELGRFYVSREWQGRGVSAPLMEAVVAEARRRGAATVWLAVWERNERAKAFYRRCGFEDVGSQEFRLGNDVQQDRVMVMDLGSAGSAGSGP